MSNKYVCECGKKLSVSSKYKHLKSSYHSKYLAIKNGELTIPRDSQILCECGVYITKSNISKHKKRKTHIKNLEKIRIEKRKSSIEYINIEKLRNEVCLWREEGSDKLLEKIDIGLENIIKDTYTEEEDKEIWDNYYRIKDIVGW